MAPTSAQLSESLLSKQALVPRYLIIYDVIRFTEWGSFLPAHRLMREETPDIRSPGQLDT